MKTFALRIETCLAFPRRSSHRVRLLIPRSDLEQADRQVHTALRLALRHQQWACVDLLSVHAEEADFERLERTAQARIEALPQWHQWHARKEQTTLRESIRKRPEGEAGVQKKRRL